MAVQGILSSRNSAGTHASFSIYDAMTSRTTQGREHQRTYHLRKTWLCGQTVRCSPHQHVQWLLHKPSNLYKKHTDVASHMLKPVLVLRFGSGAAVAMLLWRLLGHNDSGDEDAEQFPADLDKTQPAASEEALTASSAGHSRSATPTAGPAQAEGSAAWSDASSDLPAGSSTSQSAAAGDASQQQQCQQEEGLCHAQLASDSFRSACSLPADDADDACSTPCHQQLPQQHQQHQRQQQPAAAGISPEASNGQLSSSSHSLEDEQVTFLPIQPPLALDSNTPASWQQHRPLVAGAAAAAGQQQSAGALVAQQEQQGQPSGLLQPINLAAADVEGRTMTEQQWRTVRTVAYSGPTEPGAGDAADAAGAAVVAGGAYSAAEAEAATAADATGVSSGAGASSSGSGSRARAKGGSRSPLLARLPSDIVLSAKTGRTAAAAAAADGSSSGGGGAAGAGGWRRSSSAADTSSSSSSSGSSGSDSEEAEGQQQRPGTSPPAAAAAAALAVPAAGVAGGSSSSVDRVADGPSSGGSSSPGRAGLSRSPQSPFASKSRQQELRRLAEIEQQQQQQQQAHTQQAQQAQGGVSPLQHSSSTQAGVLGDWPSLQGSGLSAVWQQPRGGAPLSPGATAAAAAAGDGAASTGGCSNAAAGGEQRASPQQQEQQQELSGSGAQLVQQATVSMDEAAAAQQGIAQQQQQQPSQQQQVQLPPQQQQQSLQRLPSFAADPELQQQLPGDVLAPATAAAADPQQGSKQQQHLHGLLLQEPTIPTGSGGGADPPHHAAAQQKKQQQASTAVPQPPAASAASSSSRTAAPGAAPAAASSCDAADPAQQQQQQQDELVVTAGSIPQQAAAGSGAAAAAVLGGSAPHPSAQAASARGDGATAPPGAAAADDDDDVRPPWLRLVVSAGPATGRHFDAHTQRQELVIGRNPVVWASIPDQEVSGRHASLRWSDTHNAWQLADAGSLNGTFINGTPISRPNRQPGCPTSLKHGDQLHLGSITRVTVECSSSSSSASSSAAAAAAADGTEAAHSASRQQQAASPGSTAAAVAAGAQEAGPGQGSEPHASSSSSSSRQQQQQQQLQRPSPGQRHQLSVEHGERHTHRGDTLGPAAAALRRQQQQQHQHHQQQSVLHTVPPPPGCFPAAQQTAHGSSSSGSSTSAAGGPADRQEPSHAAAAEVEAPAHPGHSSSGSTGGAVGVVQQPGRHASRLSACSSAAAPAAAAAGMGASPGRVGALLAPVILLQFLACRVEGAVAKMVGADHRRKQCPCEDVVAWRTPLGDGWPQLGLFCVFDGHNSRNASEQAQQLLPDYLAESLTQQQQTQQPEPQPLIEQQQQQQPGHLDSHCRQQQQQHEQLPLQQPQQQQTLDPGDPHQQQQQQQQPARSSSISLPLLSDEAGVAAALTASFLATDAALSTDDGCTATAVLLEGCGDGGVLLRVANVGDSLALLVNLTSAGWVLLTEDHRIAVNASEAARMRAKNTAGDRVSQRFWGLNIARMLGDRFLKEQDVGFTAEPYVCAGRRVGPQEEVLLVVASDGLWDVVSQERVAALAAKAAAAAAAAGGGAAGREDKVAGGGQQEQQPQARSGSVAAAVAEELMQSALRLHSKDDISIMVLHLLPEAVADARRQAGPGRHASSSGSM